jgi:hypothetical protein
VRVRDIKRPGDARPSEWVLTAPKAGMQLERERWARVAAGVPGDLGPWAVYRRR